MISIVLVVTGFVVLLGLPIARYPEITPGTIKTTTRYLGASADIVEQTVATPLSRSSMGWQIRSISIPKVPTTGNGR